VLRSLLPGNPGAAHLADATHLRVHFMGKSWLCGRQGVCLYLFGQIGREIAVRCTFGVRCTYCPGGPV
jgi:hypothetical protein